MPSYPGTPGPEVHPFATIEEHGFAEQLLTFSSHVGTHVDLPSHILPEKFFPDVFSASQFAGSGMVIEVRCAPGELISIEQLMPFCERIRASEFLLLCSGWSGYWGIPGYFEGYPVLSAAAARWLTGFALKGLGVDMISVDETGSVDLPIHNILLQHGMILIENLTGLSSLLHHDFLFCCFPLKIAGAEASPVRAVALFDL
jgi:arylformamidase